MVNVVHKKCQCGKAQPTYNEPGETKGVCCSQCKTSTMVDVKHKKCKGVGCKDILYTRANPKYRGYCARCFQHHFPLDPLTFQIRSKTKEIAVRDFINENYKGFTHDRPMFTSGCDCTHRRRIDHRKLIQGTLLAIETDEFQHKSYNSTDEIHRYHDNFVGGHSGKTIYIRYNPDKYTNKNGKPKNPQIATRLRRLQQEIDKQIKRINNYENHELVEIIHLYYDGFDK